nr:membrane steroid-binding protein 1 [Quercus suber]
MAEPRQRKPAATKDTHIQKEEQKRQSRAIGTNSGPDYSPDLKVVLSMLLALFAIFGSYVYYRVDHANGGVFAKYVNENYGFVPGVFSSKPVRNPFGAAAAEVAEPATGTTPTSTEIETGDLRLTDDELSAYTGETPDTPIYLAINGTIFDVSASPAFYGPGGHYHHFVGRDATRAWVTECWDEPEQLTWNMEGIESMFEPRYMDEDIQRAANEDFEMPGLEMIPMDMRQKLFDRVGRVTLKERTRRRESDAIESAQAAHDALAHWVQFFAANPKYSAVGKVDTTGRVTVTPPAICEAAMKKRPIKGGKLDKMMNMPGSLGGVGKKPGAAVGDIMGGMPESVKQKIAEQKAQEAAEAAAAAAAGGEPPAEAEKVEEVNLGDHDEL